MDEKVLNYRAEATEKFLNQAVQMYIQLNQLLSSSTADSVSVKKVSEDLLQILLRLEYHSLRLDMAISALQKDTDSLRSAISSQITDSSLRSDASQVTDELKDARAARAKQRDCEQMQNALQAMQSRKELQEGIAVGQGNLDDALKEREAALEKLRGEEHKLAEVYRAASDLKAFLDAQGTFQT